MGNSKLSVGGQDFSYGVLTTIKRGAKTDVLGKEGSLGMDDG